MAMAQLQLLKDYPNFTNPQLTHMIGCGNEMKIEEARGGFTRMCFKDVKIVEIQAIKKNCVPSCVWRVYYQLKDPNTEYSDDSDSSNTIPPSLPEDEPSLKKLFQDITAWCDAMVLTVVGKYHTENGRYAIVEYSPKTCQCSCRDFKLSAETFTEVESNLSFLKL